MQGTQEAPVGIEVKAPMAYQSSNPIADALDGTLDEISIPSDEPHKPHQMTRTAMVLTVMAVVFPFIGTVAAMIMLWGVHFNWIYFSLFFGMYIATGLGITVGFHRLFTHRAFETNKYMTWLWAVLGSMAAEGPVLEWVAMHRKHHQHSDAEHDPHSPHMHGEGYFGFLRGLWHSHMGWMFKPDAKDLERYVKDYDNDEVVRRVDRQFGLWFLVGLIIPTVLGGLLTMSWMGALLGFLWGGAVRTFFVHHITWSINSVCHIWGDRPYASHDESRNNVVFGIFGLGEGWHNNHHAFPTSARHGLAWWQFDISYLVIRGMELLGLARRVRLPTQERMDLKRRPSTH